jgi:hypothetical protein
VGSRVRKREKLSLDGKKPQDIGEGALQWDGCAELYQIEPMGSGLIYHWMKKWTWPWSADISQQEAELS